MALIPKALSGQTATRSHEHLNNKLSLFPNCVEQANQTIKFTFHHNEPKKRLNMETVKWLLDVQETYEGEEAHEIFMRNYKRIFESEKQKENKEKSVLSIMLEKNDKEYRAQERRNHETKSKQEIINARKTHEIKIHLDRLHLKRGDNIDLKEKILEHVRNLRKLMRKLPFERTVIDNKKILKHLREIGNFERMANVNEEYLLLKLCSYATLEVVPEKNIPVFGNFAYYVVLKGTAQALSNPFINLPGTRLRPETPEPKDQIELKVGDSFGTLSELPNRPITTRLFRVLTQEDNCEFLRISASDYIKVIEKVKSEKQEEKLNVIKNCSAFKTWPKYAIEELVTLLEWATFKPNTILTSEGYRAPFIGFINSGSCHVLRKVDAISQTNQKRKQTKEVVIGKLKEGDSFGEVSVAQKDPMTYSIITETECRIGIIGHEKVSKIDDTTRRLLIYTHQQTFSRLTEEDIHKKFIEQESKKEWLDFKQQVIDDVLDKYACRRKPSASTSP